MTLEERAEEYIEKNCKMWEEGELTVDEIVRLTYKDCAKENGIQWHDLRKNPNDLPSEAGGWVCNQDGLPCYFDWGTEQWLDCEGTQIRTTEWCNMPHKKENE